MHTTLRSSVPARTLITGGMGFIGSHLAEALLEQGHRVTVLDDLSTGRFDNIEHLRDQEGFRFVINSVTNEAVVDWLASECDVVFHLAAAVGVKLIVENPLYTIQNNVLGTDVVLRAAQRHHVKVLLASTSEVYGKGVRVPFREDDDVLLGPTSRSRWSYAASKMVDEFLALAYHHQEGVPVVVFRLFNTVGPRQTGQYGMVVPRLVQQALRGEPLTVYGDGQQSRCFLHVRDAVSAILALADCPEAVGQVFNVGSSEEVTILDLAQQVLRSTGVTGDLINNGHGRIRFVPYDQVYSSDFEDMRRRVPDTSKIRRYTGWQPRYTLEDILHDVVAEFAAHSATLPA